MGHSNQQVSLPDGCAAAICMPAWQHCPGTAYPLLTVSSFLCVSLHMPFSRSVPRMVPALTANAAVAVTAYAGRLTARRGAGAQLPALTHPVCVCSVCLQR